MARDQILGLRRQVAYGYLISCTWLSVGFNIAWPVVLPVIAEDSSSLSLAITPLDVQWLVSLRAMVGCFAPLLAGTLMEVLGPRRLLSLLMVPTFAFWGLMGFLPSKAMLYIGRIVLGITIAMITTVSIPLSAELMSPRIRGVFGTLQRIKASFGICMTYIMAKFLSWQATTVLCSAPLLLLWLLLFFVPESPYWLLKQNKENMALDALRKLRGPEGNSTEELMEIKKRFSEQPSVSVKDQLTFMKTPSNYKPVALIITITLLMMLCGQNAIYQYTVYLFDESNVDLDSFTCTVLVGITILASNIAVAFVIDHVGRRPLLISSCVICALCLLLTAACLHFPLLPRWLILVFVLIYVAGLGMGMEPLFNILPGEVLPTPVRSIGTSLCVISSFVSTFISSYTFPPMLSSLGLGLTFVVYAGFSLLLAFITWMWMHETKGRTLVDLQNSYASKGMADKSQYITTDPEIPEKLIPLNKHILEPERA